MIKHHVTFFYMCGRFSQYHLGEAFNELFGIEVIPDYVHSQNIAPGQKPLVVIYDEVYHRNEAITAKWGFVPFWQTKKGYGVINARRETIAEKPFFKNAWKHQRCIIPVNSFYEWKKTGQGKKPYRFLNQDHSLLYLAGLYDVNEKVNSEKITTFCIITMPANSLMEPVHDRMPVILDEKSVLKWLNGSGQEYLADSEKMAAEPVGADINNPRFQGEVKILEDGDENNN